VPASRQQIAAADFNLEKKVAEFFLAKNVVEFFPG
jgi:hypothetical protein